MNTSPWTPSLATRTLLATLALATATTATAQLPTCTKSDGTGYTVVPLTGLEGTQFAASALNDAGRVAGALPPEKAGDPWAAFAWQDGVLTTHEFPGSVVSVGGQSESGLVTGTLFPEDGSASQVFVWDSVADQVQLVPTTVEVFPQGINDEGLIVGIDADNLFGFALDANTGTLDVIAFGAVPPTGVGTGGARAVNDSGLVVGAEVVFEAQQGFYVERPYRWNQAGGIEALDTPIGGYGGGAFDVSAKGNIAGIVFDEFFTRSSALWTDGGDTLVNLGSPQGYFVSDALALNVHDEVVAVAPNDFFGYTRGYLWESGAWTDLSCFAPPGLFVTRPLDINDAGEILVQLTDGGGILVVDTVLLRPDRPFVEAQELVRLGTPPNPAALLPGATSGPVLGSTWDPLVDHASFVPDSILDFLFLAGGSANSPSSLGTILCSAVIPFGFTTTPGSPFLLPLPSDVSLSGVTLCSQAGSVDPLSNIALTNALDITLGVY